MGCLDSLVSPFSVGGERNSCSKERGFFFLGIDFIVHSSFYCVYLSSSSTVITEET